MWQLDDRRHDLTNIVTITGLPLNTLGNPSPLWKYWQAMVTSLFPGQYGYMVQESMTYFYRRVGLETKYGIRLPDVIGVQYGEPSFSARDHVDYVDKSQHKPYGEARFAEFIINPTASFNTIAAEGVSDNVMHLFDGTSRTIGTPVINDALMDNVIDSLKSKHRGAAFAAATPVVVISDGTVEDYDYDFEIGLDS